MNEIYDIVIIGGGPAGLTAGIYSSRARMKTLLLEKMACGGQMLTADIVENFPAFPCGIKGFELADLMLKQAEAWNRGDLSEFMTPYWKDERLTFSSGGKTKRGWQATLDNYRLNYPNREAMGKLAFANLETQELGTDAMLMLGTWHLERSEPIGGNFSLVWKRIDGQWLIVHDHSSALKP